MSTILFQNIPKSLCLGVLLLFMFSCKSKKGLTDGGLAKNFSAKSIIRTHYQNALSFKTLSGKMKIDYTNGEDSQGVSVSLRMEKDKAILISAPFGVVKAYITPNRVSFYNKLQNEYFDGDFSYLSKILGTDLDFEKVQNLLLGQALFNLQEGKYDVTIVDKNYQLIPKKQASLFKALFQIEPENYKMARQELSQPQKERLLSVAYKKYQKVSAWVVPNEIMITAIDTDVTNTIAIEYKNIEFNRALNFPYKIPKGYKEIVLEKDDI